MLRGGLVGTVWYLLGSTPVLAHGFGHRYDLPLPLSYYVWGAGATVALSFVGLALFLRRETELPRLRAEWQPAGRLVCAGVLVARVLTLGLLILVIVAGFIGSQDPIRNIAPVTIWIVGWVGLGFLSLLLGNVWALLNPWSTTFLLVESCCRGTRAGRALGSGARYPEWLGVWPAFLLFVLFAWMELVWSGKNVPAELAAALLLYSCLTWVGMFVFGRAAWLRHGEAFTLVFGLFARFAPVTPRDGRGGIRLRPPAVGLLEDQPSTISMVALVIAVLATVTFDGLLETPLWARLDLAVLDWASESPLSISVGLREDQAVRVVRTLGLLGCILLFMAAYAAICRLTVAVSGDHEFGTIMRRFVLSLVPIALGYHVAHYFSLLFIGGQYVLPLISDPFGRGWNLFGTAGYRVDIGLVSPRLVWTVALVAVVIGHVSAVYLSHVTALRSFPGRGAAVRSQIPMILLMVAYTMTSLWILSQPIVEVRAR